MMACSEPALATRVRRAIERALRLPPGADLPLGMGLTPGWDSLAHMHVVLELEKELGLTFPAHALSRLVDVGAIVGVVQDPAGRSRTMVKRERSSAFHQDPHVLLEERGELVRFGPGRFGMGGRLVALMATLDACVRDLAVGLHASDATFPALIGAEALDRCRYYRNFPAALNLVSHLRGDRESLEQFARSARWDGERLEVPPASAADVECVLAPSVCFHWYASLAGQTVDDGRAITAVGRCFRYEGANLEGLERLRDFTMREVVVAGTQERALHGRDAFLRGGEQLLDRLGLGFEIATATDPFFMDAAAGQAAFQQGFELKFEFLVPLAYNGRRLAVGSVNYHQDFFGRSFDIRACRAAAHTACVGFGMERLALAFLAQHGFDESGWPEAISRRMGAES